jgi:iron complex outermembrane receptor protein
MRSKYSLLTAAVLSAIAPASHAQATDPALPSVVVTANPLGRSDADQILTPAKVLAGDELRAKQGSSLGETLSEELGVSASAFGAGASRPIIRGLEGSRVKVLENGMAVSDVSGLSNDHAVAAEGAVARQIEILRGPAALLYGSGAIGGLVNVVNERIPTALEDSLTGQAEARYSSVDRGKNTSASVDGSVGKIGLHADGNLRNTDDYRIPGSRVLDEPASGAGRLPLSATRQRNAGLGASYIDGWGYAGVSASHMNNLYGIPSDEGARIRQRQSRYDFASLVRTPLAGIDSLKFKAGYTDYRHAELDEMMAPQVVFKNRAFETRTEMTHSPIAGMRGTFGVQTERTDFSGLSPDGVSVTVPVTRSRSRAAFLVEEKDIGAVALSAGARVESVRREPQGALRRSFDLASGSIGGQWALVPGYAAGLTFSYAERAPATEELYSDGPHEATVTYDIGNPNLRKESSRNVELSAQKTAGLVRWKANLYQNKVSDFIHGQVGASLVDEEGMPGDELRMRVYTQGKATIRGAEAEVTYNATGNGWSGRLFADGSKGRLDAGESLPLQPATRIGASTGYRQGAWRAALSLTHARGQERLAQFESSTPSYNLMNASLSYLQRLGGQDITWFLLARNLLDDDIRYSTSVLKDISPLPGRNIVIGARSRF